MAVSVACVLAWMPLLDSAEEAMPIALVMAVVISLVASGPIGWIITSQKVRLAELNALLEHEVNHDALTEVLNRRAFFAALEECRARHATTAVMVVDADRFKSINDRFGHDAGDEALKAIARSLASALDDTAIFARLGGEEFGVLLPGHDVAAALPVAERIRQAIADARFTTPTGQPCPLSASVGVDTLRPEAAEFPLRGADLALYEAKDGGRNRVVAFTPAMLAQLEAKAA